MSQAVEQAAEVNGNTRPRGTLLVITIAVILVAYSIPFIATWLRVGPSQLPMLFGPDLYFYLNMAHLTAVSPGLVMNPWYGVPVARAASQYWRFGIPVAIFGHFSNVVGGGSFAVFLWTMLWILGICLTALWLFKRLLPETGVLMLSASVAFLTLINLSSAVDLFHIRSLNGFLQSYISLPYIRTFFPQSAVPLVLGYVGLQLEALRNRRWKYWLFMVAVQFLGVLVFPYATLLMALTTGVLLVFVLAAEDRQLPLAYVISYGLLCAVLDMGYVLLTGTSFNGARAGTLLQVDLKLLVTLVLSKSVITVLCCTLPVLFVVREEDRTSKWIVSSLGLGFILLYLSDGILSPALEISHHASYLINAVLAIELSFLVAVAYRRYAFRLPWLRTALSLVLAAALLAGVIMAYGMYRFFLPKNRANIEEARVVQSLHLTSDDLVIAQDKEADDPATWVPLVSSARVLFCRNSELSLSPEDMPMQEYRRAVYLFLSGHDPAWVERLLSQRPISSELRMNLSPILQRPLLPGPKQDLVLDYIRQATIPELQKLQDNDPSLEELFKKYHRIVVLDSVDEPTFSRERLLKYLKVKNIQTIDGHNLLWMESHD